MIFAQMEKVAMFLDCSVDDYSESTEGMRLFAKGSAVPSVRVSGYAFLLPHPRDFRA